MPALLLERRSLRDPHGLAPGSVRGFQRFTSQKDVFRPMGGVNWLSLILVRRLGSTSDATDGTFRDVRDQPTLVCLLEGQVDRLDEEARNCTAPSLLAAPLTLTTAARR